MAEPLTGDAATRIQRMRDEAQAEWDAWDTIGEGLDADGAWKDWESECHANALESTVNALDSALQAIKDADAEAGNGPFAGLVQPPEPEPTEADEFWQPLEAAGVVKAEVEYSGSGDEGLADDTTLYGDDIDNADKLVEIVNEELAKHVEDAGWQLAYDQYGGFEDNAGGRGTVTFSVQDREIVIHHGTAVDAYEWENAHFDGGFNHVVTTDAGRDG